MQTGQITPDPFFASLLFVEECRLTAPLSSAPEGTCQSVNIQRVSLSTDKKIRFEFQRSKSLISADVYAAGWLHVPTMLRGRYGLNIV
jgi:hypothetical protein